jgi:hypothetical protein
MRRPRGPGGRFLTADEVAEIERTKGDGEGDGDKGSLETPAKGASGGGGGSGTKRKADTDNATPSKKTKTAAPPARSIAEELLSFLKVKVVRRLRGVPLSGPGLHSAKSQK